MGTWLRGDAIQALAAVGELDAERYKVRGLDEDGHPTSTGERVANAILDWATGRAVGTSPCAVTIHSAPRSAATTACGTSTRGW